MLYWEDASDDDVERFFVLYAPETEEKLDRKHCAFYKLKFSPWNGASVYRMDIEPHIASREGSDFPIYMPRNSYFIMQDADSQQGLGIIPVNHGAPDIYCANKILDLRVDRENVETYIKTFGVLVNRPGFYFFSNIKEISEVKNFLGEDKSQEAILAAKALFNVNDDGSIDSELTETAVKADRKVYTFSLPVIYSGVMYRTELAVVTDGGVDMTNDTALKVRGLFAEGDQRAPHSLDYTEEGTSNF